jgi:hypothetical protein
MKKASALKSTPEQENGMLKPITSFKATRKNRNLRVVNIMDDDHEHEVTFLKNGKQLIIVVDNQRIWTEPETFRIV